MEDLDYAHNQARNPTPTDFAQRQSWMGRDHAPTHDHASWGRPLGLAEGALDALPSGQFSRPSTQATEIEEEAARLYQEQQEAKAAEKKAARERKRLAKPFEQQAMMSQLKPFYQDKAAVHF